MAEPKKDVLCNSCLLIFDSRHLENGVCVGCRAKKTADARTLQPLRNGDYELIATMIKHGCCEGSYSDEEFDVVFKLNIGKKFKI